MAETCYWTEQNISIIRGDSKTLEITITKEDGTPYIPDVDDRLYFTVKKNLNETPVVQKFYPYGGIEFNPNNNTFAIEIYPADTDNLRFAEYLYDVECDFYSTDGRKKLTVLYGAFNVFEEVTTYKDEIQWLFCKQS